MIRIELTGMQKFQLSIVLVALGVTIYALVRNNRTNLDRAVNGWSYPQKFLTDPTKPRGVNNPYDPKKETTVNLFICYDGQLQITEYRGDSSKRPSLIWSKLDPRHKQHIYYHDPMAPVYANKDPYGHAIALAAYSAADGHTLGLLTNSALTSDQLSKEKKARDEMLAALSVTKLSVDNGGFHPELMEKLMTALNEYRRTPGNPMESLVKANAAREVLACANSFMTKIEDERSETIEKYIARMTDILTKDQKTRLITAAKAYDAQHPGGAVQSQAKAAAAKPAQGQPAPARGRGNPPPQSPPPAPAARGG